jgi:hypothetical protein
MLKKTLLACTIAVLAILGMQPSARAWRGGHVGYTHVGPNGAYHVGATGYRTGYGGYGGYHSYGYHEGGYGGYHSYGYHEGGYGGYRGGYGYGSRGGYGYGGYHYGYGHAYGYVP